MKFIAEIHVTPESKRFFAVILAGTLREAAAKIEKTYGKVDYDVMEHPEGVDYGAGILIQ